MAGMAVTNNNNLTGGISTSLFQEFLGDALLNQIKYSKMSLKTRGYVFATFFGSCIAVGLLLASLTTEHWIVASAKRTNSSKSTGFVHYGLFTGTKDLNIAYGLRSRPVNVFTFIKNEPEVMNFWLWLGAALGTGFGLLSSAIGAIASVLKAASSSKKHSTMVLLLVANCASAISQILAFICWLVQFYLYLIHNVLSVEDTKVNWFTAGQAWLGFSFYFVVVSIIIIIINMVLLCLAHKKERNGKRKIETPNEEKSQGAIMLY